MQTRGYSRTTLDTRYPELAGIAVKYAQQWAQGQPLSVYPAMQQIVTEQIGTMMLNHAAPEKWQAICRYVSSLIAKSFSRQGLDDTRQQMYDEAKHEVMAMIDEVIATHRATPHGDHRPDLVDDLLSAMADGRVELTEHELRIHALTVYIAGIEPVAHSCTFMLYALLRHPELLQRVVAEVQGILAEKPFSPESVRDMKELRYATMEMLRLYPFAPVLQMVALEDFEFQGFHVDAGTQLIVSQAITHYLPELFADPYRFDLERYKPDRAEHRQSGAFAPYGVGHHICLGAGFAEIQIMVTMASILSTVRLELDPHSVHPKLGMRDLGRFQVQVVG
jgi:cytochrome P450